MSSQDTRITTRLQKEFHNTLFSTVHEFGHSLYERGSAAELDKTPIRGGSSLIIHESQSRFWENMVARSLPFTEKFFDNYKNLGDDFKGYSTEKFYDNVNHVVP
ncbi:hypothetical protein KBC03_08245 [Patescibacteria group bacterium]|nr:hypothetical protein [Patescibacteria group bacterium]